MMAHESTSRRPELDAKALRALEGALLDYVSSGNPPPTLEQTLADLAREARAKSIRAEQLLIVLKDVWFSIPQLEHARTTDEQNALLQRVVTLCVRTYYAQP